MVGAPHRRSESQSGKQTNTGLFKTTEYCELLNAAGTFAIRAAATTRRPIADVGSVIGKPNAENLAWDGQFFGAAEPPT